jgi:DNA-binding response OmpR family regulator
MGAVEMDGSVLILVVEDDPGIQDLLVDTLEEAGFDVVQAFNGEGAVNILKERTAELRAVVTDIDFGDSNLTGWDVARQARELLKDVPVVYMTGASADDWGSKGVPNSVLINKPFAPVQVVTAVSQLLNAGNSPDAAGV